VSIHYRNLFLETLMFLDPNFFAFFFYITDVVNGQKNPMKITFNNKGESNYTINVIGGVLVNKDHPSEIFRNVNISLRT